MATTSLWPVHNKKNRGVQAVVKTLVDYAENENKTVQSGGGQTMQNVLGYVSQDYKVERKEGAPTMSAVMDYVSDKNQGMRYVTGINCTPERAVEEMMLTKRRWPDRGNRLLFHGYQAFAPGETTPDQAHRLGVQLARELWGDRYEVVVATHLDRAHLHNHFVINTVSFLDGKKFIWDREYPRMQAKSDELCASENLSVVEQDGSFEMHLHKGARYAEDAGRMTVQSIVKEDVDCCIQTASTLEEWIQLMKAKGYRVDTTGKYLRVFPYGHSRCIRLDRRFGEEYSLDGIAAKIESQGMKIETREKTEEEKIKEIFRDFTRSRRRYVKSPKGIQRRYLLFIHRMGYRKTPKQIARTHYIFREELTKLDQYIEESKFLIYEGITTKEELEERRKNDQLEMNQLQKEKRMLQSEMIQATSEDREHLGGEITKVESKIKRKQYCLRNSKRILRRMDAMDTKDAKAVQAEEGNLQWRARYGRNKGMERS